MTRSDSCCLTSSDSSHSLPPSARGRFRLLLPVDGVGRPLGENELARAVRVDIAGHVVGVVQHHLAHLIERPGGDLVASAVDLPRATRRVYGADLVRARGAGGGADVLGTSTQCVSSRLNGQRRWHRLGIGGIGGG